MKNNSYINRLNINYEAKRIICKQTATFMSGIIFEPASLSDLYDTMVEECSYILTMDFLDGAYTPEQYNALRNELAMILGERFGYNSSHMTT